MPAILAGPCKYSTARGYSSVGQWKASSSLVALSADDVKMHPGQSVPARVQVRNASTSRDKELCRDGRSSGVWQIREITWVAKEGTRHNSMAGHPVPKPFLIMFHVS